MDYVWSPWRYHYIRANADGEHQRDGCVFCRAPESPDPAAALVAARGERSYIILNLFPYTSGHLMVVPYAHVSSFAELDDETTSEMMALVKRSQRALDAIYRPDGYNLGMNLGKSAGVIGNSSGRNDTAQRGEQALGPDFNGRRWHFGRYLYCEQGNRQWTGCVG